MCVQMNGGAGPSQIKTYHFHAEWEAFFNVDIFKECLPHLPVDHWYSKEGKCEVPFSDDTEFPWKAS